MDYVQGNIGIGDMYSERDKLLAKVVTADCLLADTLPALAKLDDVELEKVAADLFLGVRLLNDV